MATIFVKPIYEPAKKTDGYRVLVDRLWPRGLTSETVAVDSWMKELAPSPCLRIWFKHHPEDWSAFSHSYQVELRVYSNKMALRKLCRKHKKITLLYASKDQMHNHAVLLQEFLDNLQSGKSPAGYYFSN